MKTTLFYSWLVLATASTSILQAEEGRDSYQTTADLLKEPGALFQKLDTDRNGSLSREEFGRLAPVTPENTPATPASAQQPQTPAPTGNAQPAPAPEPAPPVAPTPEPTPAAPPSSAAPAPAPPVAPTPAPAPQS